MKAGDLRQRKYGANSDNESSSETQHDHNATPPSNRSTTSSIPQQTENNTGLDHRLPVFWPPFDTNDASKCDRDEAKKINQHQLPSELMCIIDDEEEEEEKQELAGSHIPKHEFSGLQQPHPGAFAVRGPDHIDSNQSTTGTVIVGEENMNHQGRTSSIPNERIPSQNFAVAAEVAPSEEDIIARMEEMERQVREHTRQTEYEMERRVRDQVQQVLQQTPRAEVVPVDANIIIEHPSTSTSPPGEVEEVSISTDDVDETVQTPRAESARAKFRLAHLEPAGKKRLVCLISILAAIIVIVVGITVLVLLSKSSDEDSSEYICMDDYASCDDESPNSCEVNLQTDKNHCGLCGNRCDLSNASSKCVQGTCTVDTCVHGYGDCDGRASTGCELDLLSNEDYCGSCTNKCSAGDSCTNGACVTRVQRSALMSLYERTNGPNWNTDAQKNWSSPNVNECDWDGVTCTNGKVTCLNKFEDNLKGTIPTDIGLLTKLTYLSFYRNELTGTMPSEMASLTKLTLLHLNGNELTGTIPTEMGRLTKMHSLHLDQNQLTGTLPSEIASMTKLTDLYVYNNNLESIPTEICNLDIPAFWGDCPPCECCTECR